MRQAESKRKILNCPLMMAALARTNFINIAWFLLPLKLSIHEHRRMWIIRSFSNVCKSLLCRRTEFLDFVFDAQRIFRAVSGFAIIVGVLDVEMTIRGTPVRKTTPNDSTHTNAKRQQSSRLSRNAEIDGNYHNSSLINKVKSGRQKKSPSRRCELTERSVDYGSRSRCIKTFQHSFMLPAGCRGVGLRFEGRL